jgi:hypothetical protein
MPRQGRRLCPGSPRSYQAYSPDCPGPNTRPAPCAHLALAFLHDIGKANRGFRTRVPFKTFHGHIGELAWLVSSDCAA